MDWKPFLRQAAMTVHSNHGIIFKLLVCSGSWTVFFMNGLCVGLPTVLIPQLRRENQTISDEVASWLPVTHIYAAIPWLVIQSVLVFKIGRKKTHIVICICSLIGFTAYVTSKNIMYIFIGELFQGSLSAGFLTTSMIILTEFVSSKYRGIFLTIKSATFFWGILVANFIGTYFRWQNIPIVGLVCGVYTLISVTVWPESPLWLVSKGKFEECAVAHRWLKGKDEDSEIELDKMLKFYENRRFAKQQWGVRNGFNTICSKQFAKPILLSSLLVCLYSFSGKLVCTVYAIEILKKITSNEETAYSGMLILDGVTVFSMYVGCIISRVVKRRVMLLGFSIVAVLFMILIAAYLYLVKLLLINENKYVSIFLLAGYSISVSCGPMILSTSIISELIPIESRTLSLFFIALTYKVAYGTFLKVSSFCFKSLGIHGTFTIFAVLSIGFLILIYMYVPETKDKTIQEINDCLKHPKKRTFEDTELINTTSKH